jgi:hypothetical protein
MSRSLQSSQFTGLRQASSIYYPAHSKNGVNVSQRLQINAYMNIASKANNGAGRSEVITLTGWGKLADVLALCITPGKEFHAHADLNVYKGRVWHNDQPLAAPDGTAILTKKYGYTIRQFDLGVDSFKHICNEIQDGTRTANWWVQGTQDYENFRAVIKARMKLQYQPGQPKFGFAEVRIPEGTNIAAPIAEAAKAFAPNVVPAAILPTTVVGAAPNPAAVAAAFGATTSTAVLPASVQAPGAAVQPTGLPIPGQPAVLPVAGAVIPAGV